MVPERSFSMMLCSFVFTSLLSVGALAQEAPGNPEAAAARALTCAPQSPLIAPAVRMQIAGSAERLKGLYAPGEVVTVSAGSGSGVQPGQQYVIRRVVSDRFIEPMKGFHPISVHTAGWLRIEDVQPNTATARIVYACDGVQQGDYLEPFASPVVPAAAAEGRPNYARPARVILGDERRQMGVPGQFMIVDRGAEQGLEPGQRLTLFRIAAGQPQPIGSATALVVGPSTSVFRIDSSMDAVSVGDLVAVQR